MTIQPIEFKGSAVLDATLEAAAGRDALLVVADSTLLDLRERIAGLALRHRLPTFCSIPEFTDAGALVGYGPSRRDSYRRAATYVKKVPQRRSRRVTLRPSSRWIVVVSMRQRCRGPILTP